MGPDLQFFDVFVGVPGSVHDSRLLRLSKFGEDMESSKMLQEPKFTVEEGVEIKTFNFGRLGIPCTILAVATIYKVEYDAPN